MVWTADAHRDEFAKVMWELVPYTRGAAVLDIGCGTTKAFPHFIGVDTCSGADLRIDDFSKLSDSIEAGSCDALFSSFLLDRLADLHGTLMDWWRCLKVGGYLVLYLPDDRFYPTTGEQGCDSRHLHDLNPAKITSVMLDIGGWDLVEQQVRSDDIEYAFFLVLRKREDNEHVAEYLTRETHSRTACVVRYGGFGDMIQAANILPALRRQGYRVTMMTTPKGRDILEHDPNIDDWYIQETGQVPNAGLVDFWTYMAKKYTKFINLSESVEGTLITMPGRANHMWPHDVRHQRLNDNYLEFTSSLAGTPYTSEARFYPTNAEISAAIERLHPTGFNVVWALAGSSCHKFYPGQDVVIARILLEYPDCRIFLVGDPACKILEVGWENEPRVVSLSGEISIRDTLTLATLADCVIGSETGVLNAVAFEPNRKVVLLSHSSVENLTKHWVNTASITPPATPCYPCHRLHYNWDYCHQDEETGAAICQRGIHPGEVFDAIKGAT